MKNFFKRLFPNFFTEREEGLPSQRIHIYEKSGRFKPSKGAKLVKIEAHGASELKPGKVIITEYFGAGGGGNGGAGGCGSAGHVVCIGTGGGGGSAGGGGGKRE